MVFDCGVSSSILCALSISDLMAIFDWAVSSSTLCATFISFLFIGAFLVSVAEEQVSSYLSVLDKDGEISPTKFGFYGILIAALEGTKFVSPRRSSMIIK